jgi:putative aldouronate transport system substrate-binding protein
MNRNRILTTALLLVFTTLNSSCVSSNQGSSAQLSASTEPEVSSEVSEAAENTADSKESELDYAELVWHAHQGAAKDNERVQGLINEYLKEKLNCTFKFITVDDSTADQKFSVVLASGEQSDIMWTSNHRNDVFTNISKGAFTPLNDLLVQYAPKMYEKIPDYAWGAPTVKGQIYAVPGYTYFTMDPTFLLRKDYADETGYDMSTVKTVFDLDPVFEKIKEKHPDVICADGSQGWLMSFITAATFDRIEKYSTIGIEAKEGNTTVSAQYLTELGKDVLRLAERWYKAGYLDPNVNSVQDSSGDRASGKLIGWFQHIAYKGYGSDLMLSQYGVEAYEIPSTTAPPLVATSTVCGQMHAIPISSIDPERAMMAMELIFNDNYLQDLFSYGIEGEHYTRSADGRLSKTDNSTNYWELKTIKNIAASSIFDNYPADYVERIEEYNNNAMPSPLIGFSYDSSDTQHLMASCKSVWDEYFVTFAGGMLEYDTAYQEFAAKMEQAGIYDLIADVQKQADEYLANKN